MKTPLNKIFKDKILLKIYTIWFLRRILPIVIAEIAAVALGLMVFARNVFVSNVLKNIGIVSESGYWSVIKYLFYSFAKTHVAVQIAIVVVLAISALIIRDIVRAILTYLMTLKRGKE